MKNWWVVFLPLAVAAHSPFHAEVERAFLRFDSDGNGVVTKDEMIQELMRDMMTENYSPEHQVEMVAVIDQMTELHDKEGDGFDFV